MKPTKYMYQICKKRRLQWPKARKSRQLSLVKDMRHFLQHISKRNGSCGNVLRWNLLINTGHTGKELSEIFTKIMRQFKLDQKIGFIATEGESSSRSRQTKKIFSLTSMRIRVRKYGMDADSYVKTEANLDEVLC